MKKSVLAALSGMVFLSACTSDGDVSNFAWRKITWESYMAGGDIQKNCQADSKDQYRYFYNANRANSVLMYNWQDGGKLVYERLDRAADSETLLDHNVLKSLFDPVKKEYRLMVGKQATLSELAQRDGAKPSLSVGEAVTSAEYYLAASSCVNGQFELKLFSQSQLQNNFPEALIMLLDLSTNEVDRPQLPETKALTNRKQLIAQSDEDAFIHYRIELDENDLDFGESYPFK